MRRCMRSWMMQVLLLGFDDTEQLLEKISDDALYKNFDAGI